MQETNETADLNSEDASSCARGLCCGGIGWRLPVLLAVVLVAIVVVNGRGVREPTRVDGTQQAATDAAAKSSISAASEPMPAASESVSLTVDFGDGRRREWTAIPWTEGMTVESALSHLAKTSGDELSFTRQGGEPSKYLLTEIGGAANEGDGGKNWTYLVNGERADRSFGVYELRPSDQVLWKFGETR